MVIWTYLRDDYSRAMKIRWKEVKDGWCKEKTAPGLLEMPSHAIAKG